MQIRRVLDAIHEIRPDLRLHGFGVKTIALRQAAVVRHLHSVDSMAWSLAVRWERYREEPGSRNSLQACREWLAKVGAIEPRNTRMSMELWSHGAMEL